jgi:hypothetical protein
MPGEPHGSGQWNRTYVGMILRDRRAVGELPSNGVMIRLPAVVTEKEWLAAHAGRKDRTGKPGRVSRERPNLFTHLLHDALTGSTYVLKQTGHQWPGVIVTSDNRHGRAPCHSFPIDTFEQAILTHLREIDPGQILRQEEPDETAQLAARLGDVRSQRKQIEDELVSLKATPKGAVRALAELEEQERQLEEQLRAARQKASHPLAETWGQAQSLLDAINRDPDARLRLRALLRQLVTDIRLLVVRRGRDRLAAVQIWFTGGEHRDYVILHRPPLATPHFRRPGRWWAKSFVADAAAGELDLRRRDDAERLAAELATLDVGRGDAAE